MDSMYEHIDQKADVYQQVLFLLGGANTKRYHTVPTVGADITVAHHSFYVAWFAWLLSDRRILCPPIDLIMAALAHDMAEQVWGDVPAPAKRLNNERDTLKQREEELLRNNSVHFPLSDAEQHILKLADCAAGMLECVQERALGNKFMRPVFTRFASYYEALDVPGKSEFTQAEKIYSAIYKLWRQADGER